MKIENNKLNNEPLSGNFTSSALGRLKIQTSLPLLFGRSKIPKGLF